MLIYALIMNKIRQIRSFSKSLKDTLDKNLYIPKTTPKTLKTPDFYEQTQEMKDMFGQDHKTPYEKYDLHLPRTEAPGGPMSMYDRMHKKQNYKDARRLMKFMFGLGLLGVLYIYRLN